MARSKKMKKMIRREKGQVLTVEATRMRHVLQWNEQALKQGLGYLGSMSGVSIIQNVGLDI